MNVVHVTRSRTSLFRHRPSNEVYKRVILGSCFARFPQNPAVSSRRKQGKDLAHFDVRSRPTAHQNQEAALRRGFLSQACFKIGEWPSDERKFLNVLESYRMASETLTTSPCTKSASQQWRLLDAERSLIRLSPRGC